MNNTEELLQVLIAQLKQNCCCELLAKQVKLWRPRIRWGVLHTDDRIIELISGPHVETLMLLVGADSGLDAALLELDSGGLSLRISESGTIHGFLISCSKRPDHVLVRIGWNAITIVEPTVLDKVFVELLNLSPSPDFRQPIEQARSATLGWL